MTEKSPHQQKIGIACPHCGGAMTVRHSVGLAPTYRQIIYQCKNVLDCNATYHADLSITYMITPSQNPNPAVVLPVAPARRPRPANDDHPHAANDITTDGPEVPSLTLAKDETAERQAL